LRSAAAAVAPWGIGERSSMEKGITLDWMPWSVPKLRVRILTLREGL
jgi:hypothetical protein